MFNPQNFMEAFIFVCFSKDIKNNLRSIIIFTTLNYLGFGSREKNLEKIMRYLFMYRFIRTNSQTNGK